MPVLNYEKKLILLGLDAPLEKKTSASGNTGTSANPELVQMICSMGFTEKQAQFALSQTVIIMI